MQQLSKRQKARKAELVEALETAARGIQEAITHYNDLLQDARDFQEEVTNEAQSYFDNRSEVWQEGERGEAYQGWCDEWSNADAEDVELALTHAAALRNMPDQPEE